MKALIFIGDWGWVFMPAAVLLCIGAGALS